MMRTTNPVFEFLDGKAFVLNGIHGHFAHRIDRRGPAYDQLYFNPSEHGKKTPLYQNCKRELGDDWASDLTNAIETYCAAATVLGYQESSGDSQDA